MSLEGCTPTGKKFSIMDTGRATGAWLYLSDRGEVLSVQESHVGSQVQTYAGYRDGVCKADKLAIVYEPDGVFLSIILPGEGSEESRYRTVSLAELEALLKAK